MRPIARFRAAGRPDGEEIVIEALLVPPLFTHQAVAKKSLAGLDESLVGRSLVEREAGVALAPARARVVAQEIDRAEGAILAHLAYDAADPSAAEGDRSVTVKSQHEQATVGGDVKAHPLVHHGLPCGVGRPKIVDRENDFGGVPVPAVHGAAKKRPAGCDVLTNGVAQVFDVEPAVPENDHGSVVVGPAEIAGEFRVGAVARASLESSRRRSPAAIGRRAPPGRLSVRPRNGQAHGCCPFEQ